MMSTTTKHQTTIDADPQLPTIRIVRDFDATADRVFRAYTEPDLVARWMGPRDTQTRIDAWQARTGGSYRFASWRDGAAIAGFYGSFHEVRPNQRLVWTFTYEGVPDEVALETVTFDDLGDGRTRVTTLSVRDSIEGRDAMLASGMETGVVDGYQKLDEILAEA